MRQCDSLFIKKGWGVIKICELNNLALFQLNLKCHLLQFLTFTLSAYTTCKKIGVNFKPKYCKTKRKKQP